MIVGIESLQKLLTSNYLNIAKIKIALILSDNTIALVLNGRIILHSIFEIVDSSVFNGLLSGLCIHRGNSNVLEKHLYFFSRHLFPALLA